MKLTLRTRSLVWNLKKNAKFNVEENELTPTFQNPQEVA